MVMSIEFKRMVLFTYFRGVWGGLSEITKVFGHNTHWPYHGVNVASTEYKFKAPTCSVSTVMYHPKVLRWSSRMQHVITGIVLSLCVCVCVCVCV